MTGISGMKVDSSAKDMADIVLNYKYRASWATFRYHNDILIGDHFDGTCICSSTESDMDRNITKYRMFVDAIVMSDKDVRYAIVDFKYIDRSEGWCMTKSKRIFVLWAPDNASPRKKMLATIHLKDVQNQLTQQSCPIVIQANEKSDLIYENVLKRIIFR